MNTEKTHGSPEAGMERIEPPCWWEGMKTPLQIMLYGPGIGNFDVTVSGGDGLSVRKLHRAESSSYLFVDMAVSHAGEYAIRLTGGEVSIEIPYTIHRRREGSAQRESFTSADAIYMLMPDRFADGDPSIDNTPDTADKADRSDPDCHHGGDLQGVINHLDYIAGVGATALWITPVHLDNEPKKSYHNYAAADFYRVDPRFGTNDLYRDLVCRAHGKGLKVIMDAVPNHCGLAHWWMDDLPFGDWVHLHGHYVPSNYRLSAISDPYASHADYEQCINGWFDTNMPDLNVENRFLLHYILQTYIWWIEWADLDGLQVDTFPYNEKNSIARWTATIIEEYPRLNIVAECWISAPAIVSYWDGGAPNADGYCSNLPSVMDFPLQEALSAGLAKDTEEWYEGMNRIYHLLSQDFLYADPRNLLIFLDNHDMARFADNLEGNTERIKLGITMLATLRGIPQIYYGTELMFRSSDLSAGDGAARIDFPGGWDGDRHDLFTSRDRSRKQQDVFNHTSALFNWRKNIPVLHHGRTMHFLPRKNTYACFRYDETETVFVFINASDKPRNVEWERYAEMTHKLGEGRSVPDGEVIQPGDLRVGPRTSLILHFRRDRGR